jgi:hypothetical protein
MQSSIVSAKRPINVSHEQKISRWLDSLGASDSMRAAPDVSFLRAYLVQTSALSKANETKQSCSTVGVRTESHRFLCKTRKVGQRENGVLAKFIRFGEPRSTWFISSRYLPCSVFPVRKYISWRVCIVDNHHGVHERANPNLSCCIDATIISVSSVTNTASRPEHLILCIMVRKGCKAVIDSRSASLSSIFYAYLCDPSVPGLCLF